MEWRAEALDRNFYESRKEIGKSYLSNNRAKRVFPSRTSYVRRAEYAVKFRCWKPTPTARVGR